MVFESYSGYLNSLLVVVLFTVTAYIFSYINNRFIRKWIVKSKGRIDDIFLEALDKPLVYFLILVGIYLGFALLEIGGRINEIFTNILSILFIVDLFYFLILLVDSLLRSYIRPLASKTKTDLDDHLIPIIRRVVRVTLVIFAGIIILEQFGYDVTSLVAGLGIGGLAFALAAKDLLGNVFGGISIFTDKPFKIGQTIKLMGYTGTVKDIGLKNTKLLTPDGTNVIIPNSKINADIIENISMENTRTVRLNLEITYDTKNEKILKAKELIKEIIKKNKNTTGCEIYFTDFNNSSLNLLVVYTVEKIDKLMEVKDEINMAIKEAFEKNRIEFAYPSQTIYLKK